MSSSSIRRILIGSSEHELRLEDTLEKLFTVAEFDGIPFEIFLGPNNGDNRAVLIDGLLCKVEVESNQHGRYVVRVEGKLIPVSLETLSGPVSQISAHRETRRPKVTGPLVGANRVTAQLSGRITAVKVKPGDSLQEGDPMFILVAMKMENAIVAPVRGVVTQVLVEVGSNTNRGDLLATIE